MAIFGIFEDKLGNWRYAPDHSAMRHGGVSEGRAMANTRADLRTVVTADGAAILDVRRGTISPLNGTGAYVWQALQQGEEADLIAQNLARDTGTAPDVVQHDVQLFIEALKERELHPDR